ncbi:MAG: type II toxin-antitoxin system VapC family toxin [Methanobacteriota archaeon]|nr:MAG: type II toxin-antitoxin system VapC family toxin [Euryarchaeota archaeon]
MRLLDTTVLVDFLRRKENARRFVQGLEEQGARGATTEVNAFELLAGAYSRGRPVAARLAAVEKLLGRVDVLPLNRPGAARAAETFSRLRGEGKDIGILDALIAGIALASGYDTIVTRDESFRGVAGLRTQSY